MWLNKNKIYFILIILSCFTLFYSCGYSFVGSSTIPFNSITIDPVVNKTYEPRLEDILHRALSNEFIAQGIQVMAHGGDYRLKSTITDYRVAPVAEFNKEVKEQRVTMWVDFTLSKDDEVVNFKQIRSPYKFTSQTTNEQFDSITNILDPDERERREVTDTAIRKEIDTIRVAREIALELILLIVTMHS